MPDFGSLLPPPPWQRRGLPLYYDKSAAETRRDVYERYDELVTRQTALHLADELHGGYPFRPLLDYLRAWLPPPGRQLSVLDIGCSVGRQIAEVARERANWDCYGLDFSYQMVRRATEYWLEGKHVAANLLRYGWGTPRLEGRRLPNLAFALAHAETLPFADRSLDLILNSFLLDRVEQPAAVIAEWRRVLRLGGRVITFTPLNFLRPERWQRTYPPVRLADHLLAAGWEITDWTDPLEVAEPLDARGNAVRWRCLAFVLTAPAAAAEDKSAPSTVTV